jgi:hypothetical protein
LHSTETAPFAEKMQGENKQATKEKTAKGRFRDLCSAYFATMTSPVYLDEEFTDKGVKGFLSNMFD